MDRGNLIPVDLRIAFWGSLTVWGTTVAVMSALSTVLLLDVWWDFRINMHHVTQIVGFWLILLILWSEFLLGSIFARSSVLPTYGRWKAWAYGLSHYAFFILLNWAMIAWSGDYFRQLDLRYVNRPDGYSMARIDLVGGILCFYSHLFVRSMIMLRCILEDGLRGVTTGNAPAGDARSR